MSQCVRPQDHIRPVTWVHAGVSLGDGEVRRGGTIFMRKNGSRWDINWEAKTLGNFAAEACNAASKKLIVRNWKCVDNVSDVDENCKECNFSGSGKVMFKVKWMVNFISFQDILLHLLVLNCWTSPHFKMHLQHWSSYCALITNLKVKLY